MPKSLNLARLGDGHKLPVLHICKIIVRFIALWSGGHLWYILKKLMQYMGFKRFDAVQELQSVDVDFHSH